MAIIKDKNYIIESTILFLILFLSSSFVVCNNIISSSITILLWLIAFFLVILNTEKMKRSLIFCLMITSVTMIITYVIKAENLNTLGKVLFSYIIVFLYVNQVDFLRFRKQYIDILFVLCSISLIGFILYNLFPILYNLNPVITSTTYSNLYLYVDTPKYNRNIGMFWEPGAYQTFINIALLLELSHNDDNINIKHIIIFVASTITTYSTTGYIALVLIIAMLFFKKNKSRKVKIFIIVFSLVLIIGLYFGQDYLFGTALSNGQSTVFGKILNFHSGSDVASASVRYNAMIKPIEAFFQSPFIGNGRAGLANKLYFYTRGMNTCTFINWFATYGIIYGMFMSVGMFKLSQYIASNDRTISIWCFIVFFVTTMSEQYIDNPMFFVFILFGYNVIKNEITEKNYCTDNQI